METLLENEFIKVNWNDRGGSDLVCTFSCMDYDCSMERGWGSIPLSKIGISSLELVCRENTWFPSAAFDGDTQCTILKVAAKYSRVLNYGFSMGGYGALKYSKMFGATHVLALSPQSSIWIGDTWKFDRRLCHLFVEEIHAFMSIKSDEISGFVICAYDPYVPSDAGHIDYLASQRPDINRVKTPWVGHETIDLFSSTEFLQSAIDAIFDRDVDRLRSLVSIRRREPGNRRRLLGLLNGLIAKKPECAALMKPKILPQIDPDLLPLIIDMKQD